MPAIIEGVDAILAKFDEHARKAKKNDGDTFSVGYAQPYAIFVHENLEAHHPIGQAKFLEQPYREMRGELESDIAERMRTGGPDEINKALLAAAIKLKVASQHLCPVDTGALRDSAFAALNGNEIRGYQRALKRSNKLKARVLKARAKAAKRRRK